MGVFWTGDYGLRAGLYRIGVQGIYLIMGLGTGFGHGTGYRLGYGV